MKKYRKLLLYTLLLFGTVNVSYAQSKKAGKKADKKEAKKAKKAEKADKKAWKKKAKEYTKKPLQLKKAFEESQSLKRQVSELKSENSDFESTLSDKDAKISEMQSDVTKLRSDLGVAKNEVREMRASANTKPIEKGVVFKVQIGTFQKKDFSNYFENNENFSGEVGDDGSQKITLGRFAKYWEADTFKKHLRSMGVKDAWIVPYKDNVRVPIKEVLEGVVVE